MGRVPRWVRTVGAAGLAVLVVVVLPAAAGATAPFRLQAQVTDEVGALEGRTAEVEEALDRLQSEHDVQLWVAYVDSFDGVGAQEWTDRTATISDLGLNDVLLAVATGDRAYAYSVDEQFPLTDEQLAAVATQDIEPRLADEDWAGAVVAAADGYAAALSRESEPGDDGSGGGGLGTLLVVGLLVVGGIAVLGLVLSRRRKRPASAGAGGTAPADELAALPLDELARRANSLLIETDDAVKTSEQELGFAVAEFGEGHVGPFRVALDDARAALAAAFEVKQRLDDSEPEDEPTRRAMLVDIVQRTSQANERLDEQVDAFDTLRDLVARAPEVLAAVSARAGELDGRLARSRAVVEGLAGQYPPGALATVRGNLDQAVERLGFARTAVAQAEADLAAGAKPPAVAGARAAEEAVAQVAALLDSVDRAGTDLADARDRLPGVLVETDQDVAAARAALAQGDRPDLAAAAAAAEASAAAVRAEPADRLDPIAALRRLTEADAALDTALADLREDQERDRRTRATLDQALLTARAGVAAAADFITTRRGAVGAEARTRLSEAQRHLEQAVALAPTDPQTALGHAQQADVLAEQAGQLAQADVARWQPPSGPGGGRSGGGGMGAAGAVLGGILIDSLLRGGGGRGGFGGGGLGPGSFGGGGTRGRRGGGGRF